MTDVFISYARADRDKVRLIAHGLAAEGFAVWWDPEIKPGKKWNDAIRRALDNAAAVVTVWSPKSVKSDWVVAETTHGNARKSLVPVTIKNCSPPIPYNMIQSADLTRWKGEADDSEWMAVLRQVRALVEAKRRMLAGAPPPGEAHGAEARLDPAIDASENVGRYTGSPSRGRMGARASRLAMGAVVATVVISAGLWVAQGALSEMGFLAPRSQGSPPGAMVAPSPHITPSTAVEVAPLQAAPEALETPGDSTPPTRTELPPPPAREQGSQAPASTTPPTTQPAQPASEDDRASLDALDVCAQEFARLCPKATGNVVPIGFVADGALAGSEQRFLGALQFDISRPVARETAAACKMRLAEAAATRRRATSGTLLSSACNALAWPATPTTAPPPAATPERATPSPSTLPERIRRVTTPAVDEMTSEVRALDACAAALARLCPAPQPTTGFSANGALSAQESTLLASVAGNATSNAERIKACVSATMSLQQTSAERREAGAFGQACRSLAPTRALSPNVMRAINQPPVAAPAPAPPPPR